MLKFDIDWNPNAQALRKFGIGGAIFLPLVAWLLHARGFGPAWVWTLVAVGALAGLLALVAPKLLRPLFLLVTIVTAPIGILVNLILLTLIFYGMLLPLGLVFRLIGRDALQRKLEPERESYWTEHATAKDAGRYFKQF